MTASTSEHVLTSASSRQEETSMVHLEGQEALLLASQADCTPDVHASAHPTQGQQLQNSTPVDTLQDKQQGLQAQHPIIAESMHHLQHQHHQHHQHLMAYQHGSQLAQQIQQHYLQMDAGVPLQHSLVQNSELQVLQYAQQARLQPAAQGGSSAATCTSQEGAPVRKRKADERKRFSPVWQMFKDEGEDSATTCNECGAKVPYKNSNPTNMRKHAEIHHKDKWTAILAKFGSVPRPVKGAMAVGYKPRLGPEENLAEKYLNLPTEEAIERERAIAQAATLQATVTPVQAHVEFPPVAAAHPEPAVKKSRLQPLAQNQGFMPDWAAEAVQQAAAHWAPLHLGSKKKTKKPTDGQTENSVQGPDAADALVQQSGTQQASAGPGTVTAHATGVEDASGAEASRGVSSRVPEPQQAEALVA